MAKINKQSANLQKVMDFIEYKCVGMTVLDIEAKCRDEFGVRLAGKHTDQYRVAEATAIELDAKDKK